MFACKKVADDTTRTTRTSTPSISSRPIHINNNVCIWQLSGPRFVPIVRLGCRLATRLNERWRSRAELKAEVIAYERVMIGPVAPSALCQQNARPATRDSPGEYCEEFPQDSHLPSPPLQSYSHRNWCRLFSGLLRESALFRPVTMSSLSLRSLAPASKVSSRLDRRQFRLRVLDG